MRLLSILSLLVFAADLVYTAQISIASVTVNDLVDPLAISTSTPQFEWVINGSSDRGASYTAGQVQVWSVPASSSPVWDSGTVTTNATSLVYSGRALPARSDFSLKVRLLDTAGAWTGWASASFSTGLLTDGDWASAQWIGAGNATVDHPLLRTTFTVSKAVLSARFFVTGIGNYEAYINGERVGDLYMSPPWSQYAKRSYYDAYDITRQVVSGENVIGIAVGKGWVGVNTMGPSKYGGAWDDKMRAKAQLVITFSDGTHEILVTNRSWKAKVGGSSCPSQMPEQEYFDSRKESPSWTAASFDASTWSAAVIQTPPATALQATPVEPVRVIEKLHAVSITNPASRVWVFDFGRNIAGLGALTIDEARGTEITLLYGEKLSSGRVSVSGKRTQQSTYTSNGTGATTWIPRHTYYGFRYIQLTGATTKPTTSTVVAHRIHTDMKGIGSFEASNDLLQWIHNTARETLQNNLVTVPTDGSYLEKLPWLGDFAFMCETAFSVLDLKALITKWTQDIADTQLISGELPPWAPSPPEMNPFPSPTWGNAFPEVVWQLYQHYGDVSVLSRFYGPIQKYVKLEMDRRQSNGVIKKESWGDWSFPSSDEWSEPSTNDKVFVGTAYLYQSLRKLIDIATVLGRADDVESYTLQAQDVNSSFHAAFYQNAAGEYRSSSSGEFLQTNNVLPVAFGMTSPARVQSIVDKVAASVVKNNNHLATGVLGTKWLLPVLTENGYADLSYAVATQTTFPSWGYWRALGATTLWEEWRGASRSQGHSFLGTVVDWFYKHLAGIKITGAGYKLISIEPYAPAGLSAAKGQIRTPYGLLVSSWTNKTGLFSFDLTIPAGSTALVSLPVSGSKMVFEGEQPVASAVGVKAAGQKKGRALFNVVSGTYKFTVR
jgi:alpha-L-rhamnosidase